MILEKDCTSIEREDGTLGGPTWWVRHPKWADQERAICFRPVKQIPGYEERHGGLCERPAGWNTIHEGEGGCKTHSGNAGRPPIHGDRHTATDGRLRRRVDEYLAKNREQLMDLTFELATARQLFEEFIDTFPQPGSQDYAASASRVLLMIQAIGSLVDKISRIENRNTITAAEVAYLRIIMADILVKWISDPRDREMAVKELMSRMPGDPAQSQLAIEGAVVR